MGPPVFVSWCNRSLVDSRAKLYYPRSAGDVAAIRGRLDCELLPENIPSRALRLLLYHDSFRIGAICGTIALVLALLVAWSRLFLQRHNPVELIAGIALGVVGGFVTGWL